MDNVVKWDDRKGRYPSSNGTSQKGKCPDSIGTEGVTDMWNSDNLFPTPSPQGHFLILIFIVAFNLLVVVLSASRKIEVYVSF